MYNTPERKAFNQALGAELKRARMEKGIPRWHVSIDTGIHESSIERIERGISSTNIFDIMRICHCMEVDVLPMVEHARNIAEGIIGNPWFKIGEQ